jgi:hypothetical protein
LEGVGHFLNQEKPAEVSEHICEFFSKFWWYKHGCRKPNLIRRDDVAADYETVILTDKL